jgi:predicted amino acid racemase
VVGLCASHGIEVVGVTKGACGHPEIARAMLRGGVSAAGDSRLANLRALAAHGVDAPLWLLRTPALSQVDEVVAACDVSLNSEVSVVAALARAARARAAPHEIVVMVDLGDLREGVWPDDLVEFVREIVALAGIRIVGIGTNLTCLGGVIPSEHNMLHLVELAEEVERAFGLELRWVSGGSSSALPLIATGRMPSRINHVRIGEAILLGRETAHGTHWPDTFQDAFVQSAEIIELKRKPSMPIGIIGRDAFGRSPVLEDRGEMDRAILQIGREDMDVEGTRPTDPRLRVIGATSDELLVDVTDAGGALMVGGRLDFSLDYGGLLATMTSPYVDKRLKGGQSRS